MVEQIGTIRDISSIAVLEGDRYIAFRQINNLGTGATEDILLRNPSESGLIVALDAPLTDSTGRVDSTLRRNVTVNNAGTSRTPRNARVGDTDDATTLISIDSTVVDGITLSDNFAGSGSGGSNAVAGTQSGVALLVNPGNNVHLQVTNNTNSIIDRVHLEMDFAEFSEDLAPPSE